jgi:hypothetical protein
MTDSSNNGRNYRVNTVVTDLDRTLALKGGTDSRTIQDMYSLFLFDSQTQLALNLPDLPGSPQIDPAGRTNTAEYFFRVPPKIHDMSEPFATQVVATQNGGKIIESQGSIIKEIRLSGTTGLRPYKNAPKKIPLLGSTVPNILTNFNPETGTANEGVSDTATGHDDITFLRNLFRLYSDLKTGSEFSSRIVMIWRNVKEDDYWIVEPTSFQLRQSSQSPLTYEYTIALKALATYDAIWFTSEADSPEPTVAARVQGYSRLISTSFLFVASQATVLRGLGYGKVSALLSPMSAVLTGINALRDATTGVPAAFITQLSQLASENEEALKLIISGTDRPTYNMRRTLLRIKVLIASIRSEKAVRDAIRTRASRERARLAYSRPGTVTAPNRSESPSVLSSQPQLESVAQATVRGGETIRDVARRVLGDARKWQTLVVTNYLVYPYVSAAGGPGVLSPGDSILFPSSGAGSVSGSSVNGEHPSDAETGGGDAAVNSPIQQAYGRDLRLKTTTHDLTDISVGTSGDLSSLQGVANVDQALRIRFSTEQGELPTHPSFGARFPIGAKAVPSSFNTFRINTLATLRTDPRIASVNSLKFVATGGVLLVDARLTLLDSTDTLSTNFALRRF